MKSEWKERRMAAMFLSRADSFPEEATVLWTYVAAIVQTPVNKAMADTKWTLRHRVRAPEGVTSTSVIGEQARDQEWERERERGGTAGNSLSSEVWCWVSRWKRRISSWTHTHRLPAVSHAHTHAHLNAVKCTVMQVKSVCVPRREAEAGAGRLSRNSWTWKIGTGAQQRTSHWGCLIVYNAPASCLTLLTLSWSS